MPITCLAIPIVYSEYADTVVLIPFDIAGRAYLQGNKASNAGGVLNKFQFSKDAIRR